MYNRVILLGRLGRDPEIKTVGDAGRKLAVLRVATNRFFVNNGERQQITDWHTVVCWGGLAGISERYLSTGRLIHIEGYLQTRSFDDRDGIRRWVTEIVATNLVMVGNNSESNNQSPESKEDHNSPNQDHNSPNTEDLDLDVDFDSDF